MGQIKEELSKIEEKLKNRIKRKTAILGIGNPDKGDDGAGPLLVNSLSGKVKAKLFDCREVPENFFGKIIGEKPNTILFVDAADFEGAPGEVKIVEIDEISDYGFTTHNLSPKVIMECLKDETGADVFMIAIQPKSIKWGEKVSQSVKRTITILKQILIPLLS